ncbi:Uncharacterised protein [uncultured archaeon]|nr:Uncharacterised protein [uncultured archaeon]
MIKEAYANVKKEHPILPDFDKINKEFELDLIESEHFFLRQIKKKIAEKIEPLAEILEHIINPDPNILVDMYECKCFTNGEKKQVTDVFRHLMEQYRALLETDLMSDDNVDAEIIKKIYDVWVQDKKILIPLLKKLRECWQKHVEPKEILEYLG